MQKEVTVSNTLHGKALQLFPSDVHYALAEFTNEQNSIQLNAESLFSHGRKFSIRSEQCFDSVLMHRVKPCLTTTPSARSVTLSEIQLWETEN